jgi:capsular exopolysaccharide synthesis family protein
LGTVPHHPELEEATAASAQPWSILTTMNRWVTQHVGKTGHPDGQSGYYGYGGSRFLESLRLLNTNLQLLSSDRPFKSVILSSAMPGAGKSTIARNLAQTAATMGKRVLLIDIDLRKPTLHKRLNLSNHAGMSELLTGNATKAEVIQQALPFIEFYVITAGALPPDPIKLLASQRMHRLVEEFEQEFDLVVYDAPPLVGLADAPLLATHTDGLILISRIGRTDRNLLKHALDNLKMAKIPVLGVVANDVNVTSRDGYKYYSYGSYYETGQDQPPEAESEGVTTARQNNDGQFKTNGAVGLTVADIIQLNQPKK